MQEDKLEKLNKLRQQRLGIIPVEQPVEKRPVSISLSSPFKYGDIDQSELDEPEEGSHLREWSQMLEAEEKELKDYKRQELLERCKARLDDYINGRPHEKMSKSIRISMLSHVVTKLALKLAVDSDDPEGFIDDLLKP